MGRVSRFLENIGILGIAIESNVPSPNSYAPSSSRSARQRTAVPHRECGGGVVGRFQERQQRLIGRGRGADRVVRQDEFAKVLTVERGVRPYAGRGESGGL